MTGQIKSPHPAADAVADLFAAPGIAGTWMRFCDTHLGQGREKARQFLKDNHEVAKTIRDKVLAHHKPGEVLDSVEGDSSYGADDNAADAAEPAAE